jgi:hypothetical protein
MLTDGVARLWEAGVRLPFSQRPHGFQVPASQRKISSQPQQLLELIQLSAKDSEQSGLCKSTQLPDSGGPASRAVASLMATPLSVAASGDIASMAIASDAPASACGQVIASDHCRFEQTYTRPQTASLHTAAAVSARVAGQPPAGIAPHGYAEGNASPSHARAPRSAKPGTRK